MSFTKSASLVALVLLAGPALAEPPDGFYLGTLAGGAKELDVAVELRSEGGALSGSYYYFTLTPKPIMLKGTLGPKGAVRLEESLADGKVTGIWSGTAADGTLSGTWKDPRKARSWSFKLVRSERATGYFEGAPRSVEAGEYRDPLVRHRPGPEQRAQGAAHHLLPVSQGGRRGQRVADGLGSVRALRHGAGRRRLRRRGQPREGGRPQRTDPGVLVLRGRLSQRREDRSSTFDLRTGNAIGHDDLFRKDATPDQLAAVFYPYELSEDTRAAEAGLPKDESCADVWTLKSLSEAGFQGFHLAADGFVVRPEFPHVILACANRVTVPYAALARSWRPEGPWPGLVAAHAGQPVRYRIQVARTGKEVVYTPPAAR